MVGIKARILIAIVLLSVGVRPPRTAEVEQRFTFEELGFFGTGLDVAGADLNNRGSVVGNGGVCFDTTGFRPWAWDAGVGFVEIHSGPDLGFAVGVSLINDGGLIVGSYIEYPNPTRCSPLPGPGVPLGGSNRAVIWSSLSSGQFKPIPGLGRSLGLNHLQNAAHDLNSAGQIVGVSIDGPDVFQAEHRGFLFDPPNTLTDLSTLGGPGTVVTDARAINDRGQIAGTILVGEAVRAFFFDPLGGLQVLPTLTDESQGREQLSVTAMNEHGQVIGISESIQPFVDSTGKVLFDQIVFEGLFLWDRVDGMRNLSALLAEGIVLPAIDINNAGQIVAADFSPSSSPNPNDWGPIPYLWVAGRWTNLYDVVTLELDDAPPGVFTFVRWFPTAINDRGQILVKAKFDGPGVLFPLQRSFILTPTLPGIGPTPMSTSSFTATAHTQD